MISKYAVRILEGITVELISWCSATLGDIAYGANAAGMTKERAALIVSRRERPTWRETRDTFEYVANVIDKTHGFMKEM